MASVDDQNFDVPEVNLGQFMIDNMKNYGSAVALVDADSERQYTYAEVIVRIQQLAVGLRNLGLRQGDVLCIFMHNDIEYPIIMYAINILGAVLQTMSPLYKDADIARRLNECKPKFLLISLDQASRAANLISSCRTPETLNTDFLSNLIVCGTFENSVDYKTLFGSSKVIEPADINPRTTAAILLSSGGTSGASKVIQLSHSNIVANLPQMLHVYRHRPGMCTIGVQGMFHHYGNCGVMSTCLYSGVKLVVMKNYDLEKYIHLIQKHKADILHLMPPIAAQLVKSPLRSGVDLSNVKYIHSAASPLGTELMKELMEMFNLPFISQMYGLTETGLITGNYEGAFKLGSSGVLTIGTQLKIVDVDTRQELPPNQQGEILCKGPQITLGYLNRPETTAESFDDARFFKTGDIGYVDDDGFLFVIDRVKDMIKYGDKQVAPSYIEDILVKHTDITDAAVIGIDVDGVGQVPKAFVARSKESNITGEEVIRYIESKVDDHMRLRGGVEFVQEIPRSPAGKRLRRYLVQYGADAWKYV